MMEKCSDKMRELIEDYVEARCKGWALVGCDLTRDENNKLGIRVTQTYKALEAAIGALEAENNALAAELTEARRVMEARLSQLGASGVTEDEEVYRKEKEARLRKDDLRFFAGLALAGYNANPKVIGDRAMNAKCAVLDAHALLAALEEVEQKGDEVEQDK